MKLNEYEYKYLKGQWDGPAGAAYNAVGEWCMESGYTDHFGFLTAKGFKAVMDFENKMEKTNVD